MIKIKNKKDFNVLISMINEIVTEIDISFLIDKMVVRAVHQTNSNILTVEIKKEFFEEYKIQKDVTYTINLEDLLKILRICKEDINIIPDNDYLKINSGKDKFKLTYFIGTKDERINPSFNHTTNINIPANKFYSVIKDSLLIDVIGKLCIDDDLFYLKSKSPKIKSQINFSNFNFLQKENIESFYDLSLLVLSSRLENIFWNVNVKWSHDSPLVINGSNELIKCEFLLANRVVE